MLPRDADLRFVVATESAQHVGASRPKTTRRVVLAGLIALAAIVAVYFSVGDVTDGRAPHSCQTEAATFQTAIKAYRAMSPNKAWPEGDAHSVAMTFVGADLLQSSALQFNSLTAPPAAGKWYYDPTTHQVTSPC